MSSLYDNNSISSPGNSIPPSPLSIQNLTISDITYSDNEMFDSFNLDDIDDNISPICTFCKKTQQTNEHFKQCGRCLLVYYCNKSCQSSDWPNHKHSCIKYNNDEQNEKEIKITSTKRNWNMVPCHQDQEKEEKLSPNKAITDQLCKIVEQVKLAEHSNDIDKKILAYFNVALVYNNLRQYSLALTYFNSCLSLISQLKIITEPHLQVQAGIHHLLAELALYNNQPDKCTKFCVRGLNIITRLNECIDFEIAFCSLLGRCALFVNDASRAIQYYAKTLRLSEKAKQPLKMALAFNGLGMAYRYREKFELSMYNFTECLRISQLYQAFDMAWSSYNGIIALLLDQENYHLALKNAKNCLKWLEGYNHPHYENNILNIIGEIYIILKDKKKALKCYQLAGNIAMISKLTTS